MFGAFPRRPRADCRRSQERQSVRSGHSQDEHATGTFFSALQDVNVCLLISILFTASDPCRLRSIRAQDTRGSLRGQRCPRIRRFWEAHCQCLWHVETPRKDYSEMDARQRARKTYLRRRKGMKIRPNCYKQRFLDGTQFRGSVYAESKSDCRSCSFRHFYLHTS